MAAAQQSQPSPSAAGTEQRAVLFTSGVLPVMLQHPAISSDCKTVCTLLASSRALRSAVLQHASGMADLRFNKPTLQQLCPWLCSHGQLLRSINLGERLTTEDAAHLAYALQAAAAATPGGLQLQKLYAELPIAIAGLVLQPLPTNHLTGLELRIDDTDEQTDRWMQLAAQALAGLTNLSNLSLYQSDHLAETPCMDAVVPALSGLSRLTNLTLTGCSKGALALLPQQLVELDLCEMEAESAEQLRLDHLTALTRLYYGAGSSEGDLLPPNLLSLNIGDCSATEPVAALTRLTRLEVSEVEIVSVARLVRGVGGCLRELQQLQVSYFDVAPEGPPTPAWATVVLPSLVELTICELPRRMLPGAADAISRLSALTCLSLDAAGLGGQDVATIDALARGIAGLPRLQQLSLTKVMLGCSPDAAELLSAATGLTSLTLASPDVTEQSFSQLFASGLTGLRSLDVRGCSVSAPCALLVAGCLPQLTALRGSWNRDNGGGSDANARCSRRIESLLQQRRQAAESDA